MQSKKLKILFLCVIICFANPIFAELKLSSPPLHKWLVKGRLGIQTSKGADSATFIWQQDRDNYTLQIVAPLGAGSARITGQPGKVVLQTTNPPKIQTAASAEGLLMKSLGWALPISNLFYWIQGLPTPNINAKVKYNADTTINQIVQQGWTINYLEYVHLRKINLPIRMVITHARLRVKIFINMWKT
jgi:outer membrane lipoprotein LolB